MSTHHSIPYYPLMKYGKCTPTKQAQICYLHDHGVPFEELASEFNLHPWTVCHNYHKYHDSEDWYHVSHKMGWPWALTDHDMWWAVRAINSGEAIDGADVWKQLFPEIGASTIQQNLCEVSLEGQVHCEKPLLTNKYVVKRKKWADKKNGQINIRNGVWASGRKFGSLMSQNSILLGWIGRGIVEGGWGSIEAQ